MTDNKRYFASFSILSLGYILLGLLLLFAPQQSQTVICIVLGAIAVVVGIIRIVQHFYKPDLSRVLRSDLPVGVVLVLAGVYLIARPDAIWEWLPVLLGFAIVYDSIVKLQHAFDLRKTGSSLWWVVLVAALATAVLGALLILNLFNGNVLMYYFGAVLIADGVVNIFSIILLAAGLRRVARAAAQPETPPAAPGEGAPPADG